MRVPGHSVIVQAPWWSAVASMPTGAFPESASIASVAESTPAPISRLASRTRAGVSRASSLADRGEQGLDPARMVGDSSQAWSR